MNKTRLDMTYNCNTRHNNFDDILNTKNPTHQY